VKIGVYHACVGHFIVRATPRHRTEFRVAGYHRAVIRAVRATCPDIRYAEPRMNLDAGRVRLFEHVCKRIKAVGQRRIHLNKPIFEIHESVAINARQHYIHVGGTHPLDQTVDILGRVDIAFRRPERPGFIYIRLDFAKNSPTSRKHEKQSK